MNVVLDASALLAYLQDEPGSDAVLEAIRGGTSMSAVNIGEVYAKAAQQGRQVAAIAPRVEALGIAVADFTHEDAVASATLALEGRVHGLSFGDRACLALASRLGLPALTADRRWRELQDGAEVRLIR